MGKYVRKYEKGPPITSLDELVQQEFVYWHDKITSKGWFMSWQLRMTSMALRTGNVIFKAIKKEEDEHE